MAYSDRYTEQQLAIIQQMYIAAEKLGAKSDLLGIIGSWGDTLDDDDILTHMREWNEG